MQRGANMGMGSMYGPDAARATPAQERAALRVCAAHARDARELEDWMRALGLHPEQKEQQCSASN